jgi:hypothetical protein
MFELTVKTNVGQVAAELAAVPLRLRTAILRGLSRAGDLVIKESKLRLRSAGKVTFGALWSSIIQQLDAGNLKTTVGTLLESRGETGDPKSYGYFVEFGRRPGRFPPPGALATWVRRKLGQSSPRLEFAIARKIARRGIPPSPFLVPALQENAGRIQQLMDQSLSEEVAKLNAERSR